LFGAFTYLKATQPVFAWTAAGPDLNTSADDLGWEVDFKTDYKIYNNLTYTFRAGYFSPGTAAKYLILGNDKGHLSPWELKSEITFVFLKTRDENEKNLFNYLNSGCGCVSYRYANCTNRNGK